MPRKIGGRYEVLGELGRGGMGIVEKVLHTELEQIRALKLLAENMLDKPEVVARFRSEARAMAKLRHDNIVRIYDFDIDRESGRYYLAMECIEGPTLAQYLRARGRLELAEALTIARQIASALAYAHANGVTAHRDVKPSNIFLKETSPPIALLADFGIAKIDNTGITQTDVNIATPRYGAPEQQGLRRGKQRIVIDARADVFALGLVLYEMIEGRAFLAELSHAEIVGELVYRREPIVPEFSVRVPASVVRMITRAISRDPDDRYARMSDFFHEIDVCLRSLNDDETVVLRPGMRDRAVSGDSDDDIAQRINALQGEQKRRQAQQIRAQAEAARDRALAAEAASLAPVEYEEASGQLRAASAALQASQFSEAQRLLREAMRVFDGATDAARSRAVAQAEEARQDAGRAREAAVDAGAPARAEELWTRAEAAFARAEKEGGGAAPMAATASYREAVRLYGDAAREVRTREREAIEGVAHEAATARDRAATGGAERLVPAEFAAAAADLARATESLDASRLDEARSLFDGALRAFHEVGTLAQGRGQVERARAAATAARDVAGGAEAETDAPTLMSEADRAWSGAETDAADDRHRESASGFATAERLFLAAADRARQRRQEAAAAAAIAARAARDRATAAAGTEPGSPSFTAAAALYAEASARMEAGELRAAVVRFERAAEAFEEAANDAIARHDVATVRAAAESSRATAARAGGSHAPSEADEAERAWRDADQAFTAGDLPAAREGFVRAEKLYRRAAEAAERARRKAELEAAREKAERAAREKAERAARERAEREAREKAERAARERAEREAREKAERTARERAEREAREKAERTARERAEREAREKAERTAREKAEREARERVTREAREQGARAAAEQADADKTSILAPGALESVVPSKRAAVEADATRVDFRSGDDVTHTPPLVSPSADGTVTEPSSSQEARAGKPLPGSDATQLSLPVDVVPVAEVPSVPASSARLWGTAVVAVLVLGLGLAIWKAGVFAPTSTDTQPPPPPVAPLALSRVAPTTPEITLAEGQAITLSVAIGDAAHHGDARIVWELEGQQQGEGSELSFRAAPDDAGRSRRIVALATLGTESATVDWTVRVDAVNHPPRIVQATPEGELRTLASGEVAEFSIRAEDDDTARGDRLAYVWERNRTRISDADAPAFTLRDPHPNDEIRVIVSDAHGASAEPRTWHVALAPAANHPPRIVSRRPAAAISAEQGTLVELGVEAEDRDAGDVLGYRWSIDGKPSPGDTKKLAFRVPPDAADGKVYRIDLAVSDRAGLEAPPTSWTVQISAAAPRIVAFQPKDRAVPLWQGDPLAFTASATAKGQVRYDWTVDGRKIETGGQGRLEFPADAAIGSHTVQVAAIDPQTLKMDTRSWLVSLKSRAPTTTTLPSGETITKEDVQGWLDRYRAAYSKKSAAALVALGAIPAGSQSQVQSALDNYERYEVSISNVDIQIQGGRAAVVAFDRMATDEKGKKLSLPRQTFTLRAEAGGLRANR